MSSIYCNSMTLCNIRLRIIEINIYVYFLNSMLLYFITQVQLQLWFYWVIGKPWHNNIAFCLVWAIVEALIFFVEFFVLSFCTIPTYMSTRVCNNYCLGRWFIWDIHGIIMACWKYYKNLYWGPVTSWISCY